MLMLFYTYLHINSLNDDDSRVARCLKLKNAKLSFKKENLLTIFYMSFARLLKNTNYLIVNKFSKISRPTYLRKGQISFFLPRKGQKMPKGPSWQHWMIPAKHTHFFTASDSIAQARNQLSRSNLVANLRQSCSCKQKK